MSAVKFAGAVVATALFSASAYANPTITLTNPDFPTGVNWTGFDWAQAGSAFTQGFAPAAGTNFTLTFFAHAVALQDGPTNLNSPLLDVNANGAADAGKSYEYTIVATISEQVQSCSVNSCDFTILGGTWDVYYDVGMNANALLGGFGTGYTDGVKVLSGQWNADPIAQTFTYTGAGGFVLAALSGTVTFTDGTMFSPDLVGTNAVSTLQLGNRQTNWADPGGFNGVTWAGLGAEVVFQADANQSFVPEPAVLGLMGIGLAAFGIAARRREKKS